MIWTKEQLRQPVWDTNVVYGESITMVRDDNGAAAAPLLFDPIHILEVSNAGGTEIYEEGRDWVFEDGLLKLTERSRIFAFTKDELYPAEGVPGQSFALPEGYLLFHEGSFFIDRQIIVTYTCKRDGWKGVRPVPAKEQLPRTFELLHGKKPMSVVLYGDSISARANATELMCIPPYQPDWGKLLIQHLTDHYGVEIDFHNTAVGGMDAVWARDNAKERVAAHKPDLAIIAFGMNDIGKEPPYFCSLMAEVMRTVRAENPQCEFILVATSTPNPLLTDDRAKFWSYQCEYKPYLDQLAADPEWNGGVAVADITGVQDFLLTRKRFIDITSNHVNHPNDFFYRCHANYMAGMLID